MYKRYMSYYIGSTEDNSLLANRGPSSRGSAVRCGAVHVHVQRNRGGRSNQVHWPVLACLYDCRDIGRDTCCLL